MERRLNSHRGSRRESGPSQHQEAFSLFFFSDVLDLLVGSEIICLRVLSTSGEISHVTRES